MTVLGNLSVDLIDDAPPSPGGCASFAGAAIEAAGGFGRIVGAAAAEDLDLFDALLDRFRTILKIVAADSTSSFGLRYEDENRTLTVEAVGAVWGTAEIQAAAPMTTWVHVAPLLRQDFPAPALAELAERGHQLSYDGQGLVRSDQLGPVALDRDFGLELLRDVTVLKIADDEATIVADGEFTAETAKWLGVPEILVTHGSEGCDVYIHGSPVTVPAAWRVKGTHTTGAGDMFTVCYVANRAEGAEPLDAATRAAHLVATELQRRLDGI
ncbi:carbohydrate kinase [Mycobacterium sp. GA-1841]|nr:carbohydrate kinase [Mycobacterium sp. GA-1841]